MKPERIANNVLSTIRATAKMHEFRVAPEDFIELRRDPSLLYSLAVGILGDAARSFADNFINPDVSARPVTWSDDTSVIDNIRFAATFFDAYLEAQLSEEISVEFSLLCAAAYYLADALGSASVVVRRSEIPSSDLGGGLGLLANKILRNDFSPIEVPIFHGEFAAALLTLLRNYFVLEGESLNEISLLCENIRNSIYEIGTARELLYIDIVTAICSRKIGNSSRMKLPPTSGLPLSAWTPALRKTNFPIELWPAQQRICDAGLLAGRSAVIQMPTSAGKTRATELIVRAAFLSGRTSLAIIVAPFKSLCNEIRSDLSRAFLGENVRMYEVSDSYLMDIDLAEILSQSSVLVVTPEKLLYMLRRAPELAQRIGLIVYDEGHQFEGFARGPNYELLLSSLRITLRDDAQIVLISAVIGNADQIAGWLIKDSSAVVRGDGLLPSSKNIAFASWEKERGWLRYVNPSDPDEEEYFVPRIIEELSLQKKSKNERDRIFPDRSHPAEIAPSVDIGLYLALHLGMNGSAALFCGQKNSVTKICKRVVEIFERKVNLAPPCSWADLHQLERISFLIAKNLGAETSAARAAALGVLPHHANIPHGIRMSVEHAMKAGHARIVACTSTLAQGVNFPIKYLIVTTTQQGRESIRIRDFQNLMGRAGRAGMYTESSIIFSAPPIFDERENPYKRSRWNAAKALLDERGAEPTNSSILAIFADYMQRSGTPIVLPVDVISLDLAFLDEEAVQLIVEQTLQKFPNVSRSEFRDYVEERARAIQSIALYLAQHIDFDGSEIFASVEQLAANTLAYHLADMTLKNKILKLFEVTAQSIIINTDSRFRTLIRRSPLPPANLKKLNNWLIANMTTLSAVVESSKLLELIIDQALPLVSAKSISSIDNQDLVLPALTAWISGHPFSEIKRILSEANAKVSGNNPTPEHAVAIGEDGFGYHLAMVFASIVDLLEPLNSQLCEGVSALQRNIKNGLSSTAAHAFYNAGFADRVIAQVLGEAFPNASDRVRVRSICRNQKAKVTEVLSPFPDHFREVFAELAAS